MMSRSDDMTEPKVEPLSDDEWRAIGRRVGDLCSFDDAKKLYVECVRLRARERQLVAAVSGALEYQGDRLGEVSKRLPTWVVWNGTVRQVYDMPDKKTAEAYATPELGDRVGKVVWEPKRKARRGK